MLHLRARWYSPGTGTFLSVDPVESEPPYQYVRGNPVNRVDPSGLCEPNDPICWATYERILTFCPECASLGLYDKDTQSLERILDDVMNGWRPDIPKPEPWGGPPPSPSPLLDAVVQSHLQQDDGLVIGISGAFNNLLGIPLNLTLPEVIFEKYVHGAGMCAPASGVTGGLEIVYDFKHLERGIFAFGGSNLNLGSFANVGGVMFVGKTRGFKSQPYKDGVAAYSGYFGSVAPSVGAGKFLNVGINEAIPLNDDRSLNPSGVFATTGGGGVGAGPSIPPNLDLAVTYFTLLHREPYLFGADRNYDFADPEYETLKRDTSNRIQAAAFMTAELMPMVIGGGPVAGIARQGIGEIWRYAYTP